MRMKALRQRTLCVGAALGCLLVVFCHAADLDTSKKKKTTMKLTSPAFTEGQPIPLKHTGQGQDVSPPLKWTEAPPGAKSLALICDDPDAPVGTWVHWVLYGLPPAVTELPEKVPATETLPNGARQGLNDFRRIGYGGPYPPPGSAHRYCFKLYVLDTELSLKPKATKQELLRAMEGHILAQVQLMGVYKRK
jgi:hypothetical protein